MIKVNGTTATDIKANLWEAIQAELEVNVDGKNLIF